MDSLLTADGLTLHLQAWPLASAARGKGTVLLLHGLGEHIGRYGHVAAQLNGWGWNVLGYDQRGHGRSQGRPGRLNDKDDLVRDLAAVIDVVRTTHPGPLVLLAHSMGGAVAARFVAEGLAPTPAPWFRKVDALALSSPALATELSGVQKLLLVVLGALAPNLTVNNGLQPVWVSRDPKVVAAYEADSRVHNRISARLANAIRNGGELVRARAAQWTLPTLLLFAGSDRCVAPAGSRAFAATAPQAVVTSREFGPLAHELFNEPEQAEVFAALGAWLQALKLD